MIKSSTGAARGSALGFLLSLASLLGGGVFFLPGVVDPMPLPWAIGIVFSSAVVFAATTAIFTTALDRYLDERDGSCADFIGAMLTDRLGTWPARAITCLLTTQSLLFLFGYVHEVSGRAGSAVGLAALPLAVLIAVLIAVQQRGRSTAASVKSAQALATINTLSLVGLLILIATKVDFAVAAAPIAEASPGVGTAIVTASFCFSLLYAHIGAAAAVVAAREQGLPTRPVHIGIAIGVLTVGVVLAFTIVLHRGLATPDGTAPAFFLDRLALVGGDSLVGFAFVYLVGQLLVQALQTSLGITMLTRDWLSTRHRSIPSAAAVVPAVSVVIIAGFAADHDIGGYQTALALSGVLLVPVLGGCIPLLIRHGEQPQLRRRASLKLAVAGTAVMLVPTIGHGAFVWPDNTHRALIALTVGLVVAIMAESLGKPATERGGKALFRRV